MTRKGDTTKKATEKETTSKVTVIAVPARQKKSLFFIIVGSIVWQNYDEQSIII